MDSVYKLWCEWDVGQDGVVFASTHAAKQWVEFNDHLLEMVENGDIESIDDLYDAGLVSISPLELIH